MMREITRTTFKQLHEQFQSYDPQFTIYRGVTKTEHELITTLGRLVLKEDCELKSTEVNILRTFKERAIPFLSYKHTND